MVGKRVEDGVEVVESWDTEEGTGEPANWIELRPFEVVGSARSERSAGSRIKGAGFVAAGIDGVQGVGGTYGNTVSSKVMRRETITRREARS